MKKTAIELIIEERERKADIYGYSDQYIAATFEDYGSGELAAAAACYAMRPEDRVSSQNTFVPTPDMFPWPDEYWKPTPENRIRELVKAGAMIVDEINRLQNFNS